MLPFPNLCHANTQAAIAESIQAVLINQTGTSKLKIITELAHWMDILQMSKPPALSKITYLEIWSTENNARAAFHRNRFWIRVNVVLISLQNKAPFHSPSRVTHF